MIRQKVNVSRACATMTQDVCARYLGRFFGIGFRNLIAASSVRKLIFQSICVNSFPVQEAFAGCDKKSRRSHLNYNEISRRKWWRRSIVSSFLTEMRSVEMIFTLVRMNKARWTNIWDCLSSSDNCHSNGDINWFIVYFFRWAWWWSAICRQ